jgi:hypothetical protein
MSLAVAATGIDVDYIRTTIGVSVFILIVDIITFTLRATVDKVTNWFRMFMLVLGGTWLFLTLVEIIILAILEFQTVKWRNKLLLCIKDRCYQKQGAGQKFKKLQEPLSNFGAKRFWAMPRQVDRTRRFLSFLWPVELVLMIIFLFFFTPGVVNKRILSIMALFTLPHLFQWAWIRAITGPAAGELPEPGVTNPNSIALMFTRIMVMFSLALDILHAFVRTYGLFVAPIIPNAPDAIVFVGTPIAMVFATLSSIVVYGFVLIGILEGYQLQKLVEGLEAHQKSPQGLKVAATVQDFKVYTKKQKDE